MKTAFERTRNTRTPTRTKIPARMIRIHRVSGGELDTCLRSIARTITELAKGAETDPVTARLLRVLEKM